MKPSLPRVKERELRVLRAAVAGPITVESLRVPLPHLVTPPTAAPILVLMHPTVQADGSVSGLIQSFDRGGLVIGRGTVDDLLHGCDGEPGVLSRGGHPDLRRQHLVIDRVGDGLELVGLPGTALLAAGGELDTERRYKARPGERVPLGPAGEILVMGADGSVYLQLFVFAGRAAYVERAGALRDRALLSASPTRGQVEHPRVCWILDQAEADALNHAVLELARSSTLIVQRCSRAPRRAVDRLTMCHAALLACMECKKILNFRSLRSVGQVSPSMELVVSGLCCVPLLEATTDRSGERDPFQMASFLAISAVSQAVKSVLEAARVPSGLAGLAIELLQLPQLAQPPTEAVALVLYRVTLNGNIRSLPPRLGADGRRFRPTLPVDLHYLLTAWARTADRQQDLLGWALRTIEDQPLLPASLLNQGQPSTPFRPEEAVDFIANPLSQAELVSVWEVAKPQMQISMTYVARAVSLDSDVEVSQGPRVTSRVVVADLGGR